MSKREEGHGPESLPFEFYGVDTLPEGAPRLRIQQNEDEGATILVLLPLDRYEAGEISALLEGPARPEDGTLSGDLLDLVLDGLPPIDVELLDALFANRVPRTLMLRHIVAVGTDADAPLGHDAELVAEAQSLLDEAPDDTVEYTPDELALWLRGMVERGEMIGGPSGQLAWPSPPLGAATVPHPDGLRLAPGEYTTDGVTFVRGYLLYPPASRSQAEAEAARASAHEAMSDAAGAVLEAALDAAAPPLTAPFPEEARELAERTFDPPYTDEDIQGMWGVVRLLVVAGSQAGAMADAAAAALRATLGPAPLSDDEQASLAALGGYIRGSIEAVGNLEPDALSKLRAAHEGEAPGREREEVTRLDRVELLPLPTAPWARLLRAGYTAAAAAEYEQLATSLEYGDGLVIEAGKAGQLRFAPAPPSAEVAATFPGIDAADAQGLADVLKRDGRLRGALIALAAVHFTVRHPGEWVEWDDRFRTTFGWKRPGGGAERAKVRKGGRDDVLERSRRDFDRLLYSRLRLGERAEEVGKLYSHGTQQVGTDEGKLYAIGRVRRDNEGRPVMVRFDPVGVSADMLRYPARSESLGYVQDILSLPDTAPGRWAAARIVMLATTWRTKVNREECRPVKRADGRPGLAFPTVTRAYLFKTQPPDPPQTPGELLGSKTHRARAVEYDAAAWELLREAHLIDDCIAEPTRYAAKLGREPWPHVVDGKRQNAVRNVDWREAWLRQRLDPRPGGRLLSELLEARDRKTQGLQQGRQNARRKAASSQAAQDS